VGAVDLLPTERILIIGKTQSGKSTLATRLAAAWDRVLVYDPKHDAGAVPPGATVRYGVDRALEALPGRVVYRPLPSEQGDVRRHFDRLVARILHTRGHHGIVIHELRDLSPTSGSMTYLSAAYRQGASQHVPMILCAQRPFGIDVSTVSEAEHFALFRLQYPNDLTLVSKLFGLDQRALSVDLPPYWYHHRGPDGVVRRMRPVAPLNTAPGAPRPDVPEPGPRHGGRLDHRRRSSHLRIPGRRSSAE
jgi:hypothetical protein